MSAADKLRVVTLESRNAPELQRLLERHGCSAILAPSLREVPLSDQHEAFAFGQALLAGQCDVLVLLTGVGTRMLVDALCSRHAREDVLQALSKVPLVCRGPKPVAALKALGLRAAVVAPEPNTSLDVVRAIEAHALPLTGRRVYVQEYGRPNEALLQALRERGGHVQAVSVYAWQLPSDLGPMQAAIERVCAAEADAVLFTTGIQLEHLFEVATRMGRLEALRAALRRDVVVASVGPSTSAVLRDAGLCVDVEPEHPKMGQLVLALAKDGARLLAEKRAPATSCR